METTTAEPILRRGTPDDIRACHDLLWASATDLGRRHGTELDGSSDDWWRGIEPVHDFLAEHAAEWWVAEAPEANEPIGYARSIERGGLFELTELFVRPGRQSKGIGRQLIEHAFPIGRGDVRSIIATTDVRASRTLLLRGHRRPVPVLHPHRQAAVRCANRRPQRRRREHRCGCPGRGDRDRARHPRLSARDR